MPVFLHCCLCDRKSVDGFLSRYAWEHLEANPHGTLQVCPLCREEHPDWESRARATLVRVAEQHGPGSYGIA
jgi:hypothetical protein